MTPPSPPPQPSHGLAFVARLGGILGLSAIVLAACDDDRRLPLEVEAVEDAPPVAQLSQWTTPGSSSESARVTVGLELASQGSGGPLGALEGRLRWDPDELAYVGEVPDLPTLTAVNRSRAQEGEMRFAMVNAGGIPAVAAVWVFEVLSAAGVGPQGGARVDLELTRAHGTDFAERAVSVVRPVRANASLPSPDRARHLDLEAWDELLGLGTDDVPKVPRAAEIYGDATQDGLVQSVDAQWTLSATVGSVECILGTDDPDRDCLAANVHPFNEPGLGGPGDSCPPGLDSCTSWTRTIQAVDALAILHEAVGNDPPIAGDSIPSLVRGDTVTLSGVITGTRTLTADSVYQLQGAVAVGEESGGWVGASGTLVIPAGTQIIAGSGASLSITAAGTIEANGTELDPIVFECADATAEPGCWDGIVLAGTAPVNDGTPAEDADSVAGWTKMSGDLRTWMNRSFGGNDTSHDGGTLEHVIVSHAGGSGAALTLGGVGDGTTVRFVQTHASSGAGLQVIGGTVRASHLLSTAHLGDYLRVTNGHQGSLQFVTVQMEPDTTDLVGIRVANGPDDPDVTPRTSPELWNLTVIGGTAFTEQHTALAFEDAGATVRNALLVKTGVGLTADAGACDRLDVDSLDVDHTSFLGSLEPLAGSCTGDLETALAAGSVEGQDGSILYQAHLTNPFDGELLDDRGGGDTISAATPNSPLDPTGDYLGSSQPGGDQVPWYTGWMRTWERASGFASLPDPGVWNPPPADTFVITDQLGFEYHSRRVSISPEATATEEELQDLFSTGGIRLLGTAAGYYIVRLSEVAGSVESLRAARDSLVAHPAVRSGTIQGGEPRLRRGIYPIDGAHASSRSVWHPDSLGILVGLDNWKTIRAPQAWYCENGTHGEPAVAAGIIESDYYASHQDLESVTVVEATPREDSDSAAAAHGVAVAGQLAARGNNGKGIAGMNWNADLTMITLPDTTIRVGVEKILQGVRAARAEGVHVLSTAIDYARATSYDSLDVSDIVSELDAWMTTDDQALLVIPAGQRDPEPIPVSSDATISLLFRAVDELLDLGNGHGSRVLAVTGSEAGVLADTAKLYNYGGSETLHHVAAPYLHPHVLAASPTGTELQAGTSFGAPMVAGLATLLYQMDPTLTAEEVVDLIVRGAQEPDVVGASGLVDQISGVPGTFNQSLYELDAFSSMQLLSRENANTPVCGLDVYQLESNNSLRIDRETPQDYSIPDSIRGPISVAPGGRAIAVDNHIYNHLGNLEQSFSSYAWVEFLESPGDTAFYGFGATPDAFTAKLIRGDTVADSTAISGINPFMPRPLKLSPDGTRIQYVTRDSTLNDCDSGNETEFEFRIRTDTFPPSGSSTIGPLLTECENVTVDRWKAVQWNEFGDELITTRYTDPDLDDPMTVRQSRRPLSASATQVYQATSGREEREFAFGQIPGAMHYKRIVRDTISGGCTLYSRELDTPASDVADKTILCPNQGGQWSIPGLAPRPTVAIPEKPD